LPWIGVEAGKKELKELKQIAEEMGLRVLGEREIEVKTRRGWIKFVVLEVAGFVEGAARELARMLGVIALEAGPHLVLGETSARLWNEAVLVVFPDGEEETIPILTYDGFLDLRLPTDKVKGVEGTLTIRGKPYRLPLSADDLIEIYKRGEDALKKVEKAASVYGLGKIVSSEALKALRKARRGPPKYEVDYDAGLALVHEGNTLRTIAVETLVLELAVKGFVDEAYKVYAEAPEEIKERIRRSVADEYELCKSIGGLSAFRLRALAEKIGVKIEEEEEGEKE